MTGSDVVLNEVRRLARAIALLQQQVGSIQGERLAYSFTEAARKLGRSPRTVARMVKRGELHPVLVSGSSMISAKELLRITTPETELRRGPTSKRTSTGAGVKSEVEEMLGRKAKRKN